MDWRITGTDREVLFGGVGTSAMAAHTTIGNPVAADYEVDERIDVVQKRDDVTYVMDEAAFYGTRSLAFARDNGLPTDEIRFRGAKVSFISDGLSKTVLLNETTIPESDGRIERVWFLRSSNIGTILWSHHRAGRQTAMADGSVRLVPSDIDERVLALLVGRQNGVSETD